MTGGINHITIPLNHPFKLKQHESIFLQTAQRLEDDTGLCNDHQGQNGTCDRSLSCR